MGFFDRFKRKPASVRFDDDGVVHQTARGTVETIRWDELDEVGILTTDDGPWGDDVYWMLLAVGRTHGCGIRSTTAGMDALLTRLQQLPGFDNKAVILAMGCAAEASFLCWRRTTDDVAVSSSTPTI